MKRYLIEVPHDPDPLSCAKVVETFLRTGSQYLARADWGCTDGTHAAWMIVEAADKEEARQCVPPPLRRDARVVLLNTFRLEDVADLLRDHAPSQGPS